MSQEKKVLNDDDLKKTTGGYGDPHLCLPVGAHVGYRIWTSDSNWTTRSGIIMKVEKKEDDTYVYDILQDMSSIHVYVKAEDLYLY